MCGINQWGGLRMLGIRGVFKRKMLEAIPPPPFFIYIQNPSCRVDNVLSESLLNTHTESNKYITFAFVKYNELFRLLKKDGWFEVRQNGSHVILKHPTKPEQLTVPNHSGKEVKKGLLTSILKQATIKTNKR